MADYTYVYRNTSKQAKIDEGIQDFVSKFPSPSNEQLEARKNRTVHSCRLRKALMDKVDRMCEGAGMKLKRAEKEMAVCFLECGDIYVDCRTLVSICAPNQFLPEGDYVISYISMRPALSRVRTLLKHHGYKLESKRCCPENVRLITHYRAVKIKRRVRKKPQN